MPDWNHALADAPARADVLVIGSGPSGAAAARVLALGGRSVVLVDAKSFPRDKACGDGLVPDSHAALKRLGLLDAVMGRAQTSGSARCVGPNRRHVDIEGPLAVLPRREFDALLCQAAVEAGARHVAPARLEALLRDREGRVLGARLATGGCQRSLHARWVVIATGAAAGPLERAGLCRRRAASGMALRGRVHHPDLAEAVGGLRFVWHPRLRGGYGWIFQGPDQVYNIGTGVLAEGGSHPPDMTLRQMFDAFVALDPVAGRLMAEGRPIGELKGAPLRCDLEGAVCAAPGVLVVGDAAGATYSFTGEGIGKALETGIAAAEALLAHPHDDGRAERAYLGALETLRPRFEMYRQAGSFNRHPWLVNVMIWRARHSPRIRAKLADILAERRLPGSLLTWRGLRTMLLP